mmetsp:Transcript_20023/g.52058  ORF Transcript_20023/g.52058 Transcript_20023/m.52058 type:complete len:490 (+) Transcript_20023:128-1597(+)
MMLAARAAVRRAPMVSGSVRYPAVAARAAQRGAPVVLRAASTRSAQRLAVVAVPARGFAATSANNLVPAALRGLDYVGTVAFAASGTMVAGHAGMDILGCTMVGTITSLGGGTIRDLLLGRTPVFWFREVEYLLLCVGTALMAFYAHDKLEGPVAEEALWWGDTLGIGAFSVVGAQAAASVGMGPLVVPICGMFTATCGGLVRDVLCRRPPKLLYSAAQDSPAADGTLYAPAALSGASAYALLHFLKAPAPLAIALGCATTVGVRTYGYARNVKLPTYSDVPADAGPAPRLAAADAHLVVTAWGPDATGHVAALARVLADARANISASKIATIGDDIVVMLVVSAPRGARAGLVSAATTAGRERGLKVDCRDVTPSHGTPPAAKVAGRVALSGPDSPGLVSNVAALLSKHSLNISSLDTRVVGVAPEGLQRRVTEAARSLDARDAATDLFCLEAIVTAPEKPDAAALKRDVAALRKRCRLDVLDVVMEE